MTPEQQAVIEAAQEIYTLAAVHALKDPSVKRFLAAVDRLAAPGPSSIDTPDNRTGQT